jgi:hypothetical protein
MRRFSSSKPVEMEICRWLSARNATSNQLMKLAGVGSAATAATWTGISSAPGVARSTTAPFHFAPRLARMLDLREVVVLNQALQQTRAA